MSATVIEISPFNLVTGRATGDHVTAAKAVPDRRLAPPPRCRASVSADRHHALWTDPDDRAVWLVRAPTGYGKSLFLAGGYEVAQANGEAAAWLSCDAGVTADLLLDALKSLLPEPTPHPAMEQVIAAIEGNAWLFVDAIDRLTDPAALDLIESLIRCRPPGLRMVAACRADPPMLIDEFDLQGLVRHLGVETLALTDLEARRLYPDLPHDMMAVRHRALGGWAAGLRAPTGGIAPEQRIADRLAVDDRALLASLVITGHIDGDGLAAWTPGARDRLAALTAAGHFVVRSGTGYRLLPPMAAALLPTIDAATRTVLHRDAAEAAAARGDMAVAIDHAIQAGEVDRATAYLHDAAMPMIRQGHVGVLRDLAARLPDGAVPADAATWLSRLADPLDGTVSGLAAIPTGLDADFVAATIRADQADAAVMVGDWRNAHAIVAPLRARAMDPMIVSRAAIVTAACYRLQGQPGETERVLIAAYRQLGADRRAGPDAGGLIAPHLARAAYERGDLPQAMALLDSAPVSDAVFPSEDAMIATQIVRVRCAVENGDRASAASAIEQGEGAGWRHGRNRLLAQCIVDRLRLGLPSTITPDALLPAEAEEAAVTAPESAGARIFAILGEVRIYEAMDAGDRPRLNLVCDRLKRLAAATHDADLELRASLFSILPQLSGRCDRMVDLAAVKILNRGANNGFRRTITDVLTVNGVRVGTELSSASFVPSSFLALLAQVRPANADIVSSMYSHARGDALSFLTGREIDILSTLASGISNKELARALKLTPETVKWHLKNIMRKLVAETRSEAVAHAEALGFDLGQNCPSRGSGLKREAII